MKITKRGRGEERKGGRKEGRKGGTGMTQFPHGRDRKGPLLQYTGAEARIKLHYSAYNR